MPATTFHSLRIDALAHGKKLISYGREIGAEEFELEEKLLKHAAPSLVAVIGDRGAGKRAVITGLAELSEEEQLIELPEQHYKYYHHVEFPVFHAGQVPDAVFLASKSQELRKLSFVEICKEVDLNNVEIDYGVLSAEGIIFLINAKEPWSGTLWRQVALYSKSHAGRIIFCVTNTQYLHPQDYPVLQRHLQERIAQVFPHGAPLKKVDYADLFTYHEIRVFLENQAVGHRRWNELRSLKGDFQDAFSKIEVAIVGQRKWLEEALEIASSLKEELFALRHQIRYALLLRIETMGTSLKDEADEILRRVRGKLTTMNYLSSLFKSNNSLVSFQEGLESILSDALYKEIGGHYNKTNQLIAEHAQQFSRKNPFLAKFCPDLSGDGKALQAPFSLEKNSVNTEIHAVLRNLRLKPLFRQELEQIDQMTNVRLCVAMIFIMAAGFFGGMQFHTIGFLFLAVAGLAVWWCFWLRNKALDSFADFLNEWFLGVGPRLLEPIDTLSTNLVNHAIDTYGDCFIPYLEVVKDRQEMMPERIREGRSLYVKNEELIKMFSVEEN